VIMRVVVFPCMEPFHHFLSVDAVVGHVSPQRREGRTDISILICKYYDENLEFIGSVCLHNYQGK